jgi:hypothetical protein
LVGYILAGGRNAGVTEWTLQTYQAQGCADDILREYLDRTIEALAENLQEPAWQVLAVLANPGQRSATEAQVVAVMEEQYNIPEAISRQVLADLQQNHLVERARAFRLASESLRPRIEMWLTERSARERLRQEVFEQLRSIRNSALRGLLGGAVGFGVAYICLPYISIPTTWGEVGFYAFLVALRALAGGIVGFLMILTTDLLFASFNNRQKKFLLPLAIGTGAASFALLPIIHTFMGYLGNNFPLALALAALQGALWGAIAGIGMALQMLWPPYQWAILAGTCVLSGVVLFLGEGFLGGLQVHPGPGVFLAGLVMPLGLLGIARNIHSHYGDRR